MTSKLPKISWPEFLLSAPYFTSALFDSVGEPCADLPAMPRAALYWSLFDGEVSNGGVEQYFYNQALSLREFDRTPDFMAAHPVLAPHKHFFDDVHDAWNEVSPQVRAAREMGEWPEELFKSLAPRFAHLETAFYAVNHDIAQALNAHIVADPHAYFEIAPLDGVGGSGVTWIECQGKGYRGKLRFVDGFPVGPNVFERGKDGQCDVVWFTADRQILVCERAGWGGRSRNRDTIHYPSRRTQHMRFEGGRLESQTGARSFWYKQGLHEYYHGNGGLRSSSLYADDVEILSEHFHANGRRLLWTAQREGEEHRARYWPNGQLNTRSTRDEAQVDLYSECFSEDGTDLAPGGDGILRESIGDGAWREGTLVNGLVQGEVVWFEKDGTPRSKANFKNGKEK